jgi:predicted nucleic acid-binding protein
VTDTLREIAVRMNYFDASALVKVYTNEAGSNEVRKYFHSQGGNKCTTTICYYETLTVLKRKRFYRRPPNSITDDEYHRAAFELSAWFSMSSENVRNLELVNSKTFPEVQSLARKYSLDLSDAFQILSVTKSVYSPMIGESQTTLVTADKKLAAAARSECVKVREYKYDRETNGFVVEER